MKNKFRSAYDDVSYRVKFNSTKPSMTKQSFKNECDINQIMKKWQTTGAITHFKEKGGIYDDFTNIVDYQSALNAVMNADDSFMALPSSIRTRFQNDPQKFLEFATDPSNQEEIYALGLAERPVLSESQAGRSDGSNGTNLSAQNASETV